MEESRTQWVGQVTVCEYCGEPVDLDTGSGNYKKVEGWVKVRRAGGANEVALRRDLGAYMHHHCMDLARAGIHPNQGQMFE